VIVEHYQYIRGEGEIEGNLKFFFRDETFAKIINQEQFVCSNSSFLLFQGRNIFAPIMTASFK
jgi:hypothetical protein